MKGTQVKKQLYAKYNIRLEMTDYYYALALTSFMNEEEDSISIKMNGVSTTDTFDMFDSEPGKLTESKVYYGVDSKNHSLSYPFPNSK